ncbi:MAG: hypothetical protein H0T69_12515 [Thermoleophilaceae bacterium]|nr:hypothetical protein [Thermoleophilaceae bacterium]
MANAGRGGSACQGKGEDRFCLGATARIVRVADGKVRTVAKGLVSGAGAGGVVATGAHGVSVAPDGTVFTVTTSGPPGQIKSLPAFARRLTGRLFDVSGGNLSAVARIRRDRVGAEPRQGQG